MPKDDINYKFTENGIVYDFYDVFVPAENFRQPTLFTWGNNTSLGQLGINDTNTAPRSTPVTTFAGGTTWKSVSSAGAFTLAIKTDGTLWGWGRGNDGQFGNNALAARPTPVTTFAGGNNWKQVSTGGGLFTAAIKTDGSLWTFGQGSDDFSGSTLTGKLGTNDGARRATPVTTFAGGNNWKQVSCGGQFTSAIKTDGSLWTWGANNFGQLGINAGNVPRSTPVTTFSGGTDWKQVSCGSEHTIAIKTDGSLWIWGYNNVGQLGINDTTTRSTPVTTFVGGNTWKSVAGGYRVTTAIKTDGSLWTCGSNNNGQLGINNTANRSIPVTTFAGGNNWKSVAGGGQFTSAIKTDGSLWTWGLNTSGELGDNTTTNRSTPVTTFAGGNNWKQVSGSAAIKYSPDP
jgi:alpha-tubulin suppressor-like RCC1 family protein